MKLVIDIPDNEIPIQQDIISVELHCIDGKIFGCNYPIEELPKKGKWIVISCEPTDIFKCSECGMRAINPYRYCHSCGTKMEVEDVFK